MNSFELSMVMYLKLWHILNDAYILYRMHTLTQCVTYFIKCKDHDNYLNVTKCYSAPEFNLEKPFLQNGCNGENWYLYTPGNYKVDNITLTITLIISILVNIVSIISYFNIRKCKNNKIHVRSVTLFMFNVIGAVLYVKDTTTWIFNVYNIERVLSFNNIDTYSALCLTHTCYMTVPFIALPLHIISLILIGNAVLWTFSIAVEWLYQMSQVEYLSHPYHVKHQLNFA